MKKPLQLDHAFIFLWKLISHLFLFLIFIRSNINFDNQKYKEKKIIRIFK